MADCALALNGELFNMIKSDFDHMSNWIKNSTYLTGVQGLKDKGYKAFRLVDSNVNNLKIITLFLNSAKENTQIIN